MKALLCAVAFVFLATCCFGQKVPNIYQIRADTVRIYNVCDTAELVLENRTKDTLGFLFNKGKGRTEFRRLGLERIGASQLAIKGQDTVDLNFSSYGDTRYDLLSTNFYTITPGDSMTFFQWPTRKVVGYDAYNSPDMPVLSNQAIQSRGSKLYYNGLVVSDGSSGFDLAVNWDGELNGPNGAFLRTRDDTKTAWSRWRELLFKDYADTAYAPNNSETLQSVTSRGNSTSQNIIFTGTPASSAGLSWNFNSDVWRIFVESPQDTPAGDMIFESADNDQEGWIFRSKNGTTPKQVLNIQPEGTFTFLGNNILHAGNHVAGSAFTPTLTGANVLSTITTNASGHVTALTTRALTPADIGAAPAATSGNYVQNLSSGTQTANFSINGTGNAGTGFSSPLLFSNNSAGQLSLVGGAVATGTGNLRGAEIDLIGGSAATIPGEISFRTGTGGSGAPQPERMRIDAAGNVGIGTTTPLAKLTVSGPSTSELFVMNTTAFGGNTGAFARFYNIGTPGNANQVLGGILMGTNPSSGVYRTATQIEARSDTTWTDGTSHPSNLLFYTVPRSSVSPTERMRIAASGNVGIGTGAPAQKLEVANGNIRANGGNVQVGPTDASILNALTYSTRLGVVGTFTNTPFAIYTNSTERVRVDSIGRVGIGTNNPGAKLQVSNGTQTMQFGTGTNTSGYTSSLGSNDDGFNFSNNVATRGFNFKNNNGTLLTIANDGKVGINNTAPGSKLDVTGVVRVGMNSGPSDFPATGAGLTVSYNGVGYIVVQDRTTSTYKDLELQGSNINLITNDGVVTMHGAVNMDGDLNGVNNISMNGGLTMSGGLNISGDLTNVNNITANGKVTAAGDVAGKRYLTKTATLTFTSNASTAAILGTGYSVTVTGGDAFMRVTIRTGTGISTTGTIGTIAFSAPFANIPAVVWSANDVNAMDAKIGFTSSSVNNVTIFNKTALAASTTYTYSIMVGGW